MDEKPEEFVEFKGKKVKLVYQRLGPFNIKKEGREIANKSGLFMVVKAVRIKKMPGQNNRIFIELVMPKPDDIEVEVSQIGEIIADSKERLEEGIRG